MKVLVIGAASPIGQATMELLLSAGHEVIGCMGMNEGRLLHEWSLKDHIKIVYLENLANENQVGAIIDKARNNFGYKEVDSVACTGFRNLEEFTLQELSIEAFEETIAFYQIGTVVLYKKLRSFLAPEGSFVFLSPATRFQSLSSKHFHTKSVINAQDDLIKGMRAEEFQSGSKIKIHHIAVNWLGRPKQSMILPFDRQIAESIFKAMTSEGDTTLMVA